ncbi:hypothetical protein RFI_16866 [Reticulomyxa filosa]|uniref:Uncharacterized protein n=1 Tax=Reticulomyxa filosa TaxID=46433 RepID=X6N4W5_RETFI|nr:hypothetical protein RFI_16866 [Reticulomyxa filosa]|eukprot:ETO20352.1 hypothetical protein RFI_16866 [Reticulomyxa filosa]
MCVNFFGGKNGGKKNVVIKKKGQIMKKKKKKKKKIMKVKKKNDCYPARIAAKKFSRIARDDKDNTIFQVIPDLYFRKSYGFVQLEQVWNESKRKGKSRIVNEDEKETNDTWSRFQDIMCDICNLIAKNSGHCHQRRVEGNDSMMECGGIANEEEEEMDTQKYKIKPGTDASQNYNKNVTCKQYTKSNNVGLLSVRKMHEDVGLVYNIGSKISNRSIHICGYYPNQEIKAIFFALHKLSVPHSVVIIMTAFSKVASLTNK